MKTPGSFTAQYYGVCATCEGYIAPGDPCRYNEASKIVHADDSACDLYARRVEQRSVTVCTTCWLTKPCDCED